MDEGGFTYAFLLEAAALTALSLPLGYWLGSRKSTLVSSPPATQKPATRSNNDSDSEDDENEGVSSLSVGDCKLVLVVRRDLGMSPGKIAAQCSHAALACYKSLTRENIKLRQHWEKTGQSKIAVQCEDEEALLVLQARAQSLNLCARSIQDAGRTQVAAGSTTVLGIIGPNQLVEQLTETLKVL